MRPAEGGQEVIQGVFVCYVDGSQLQADFVFIAMKHVVMPDGDIEKTSSRNAGGIFIVVFRIWLGHIQ